MSEPMAILDGVDAGLVPDSPRLAGIMTVSELLAAGLSRPQLRGLARQGVLLPLAGASTPARHSSPRRLAGRPARRRCRWRPRSPSWAPMLPAATAARPSSTGSTCSGGRSPVTVTVTRPLGGSGSNTARPGIRLHIAALPAAHATTRRAVPVTSVARTVVDLARTSSFRAGVVAADSALRAGQVSKAELHSLITACGRWPGIQRARRVVAFSDARSESVFESISRVAFDEQGLPPPDLQVWVGGEVDVVGRADFLWTAYRTIGEADGAIKYADPSRARAQLQRDAELRAAGFEVVHFTWDEIMRAPGQVAASIRTAFRRGAAA